VVNVDEPRTEVPSKWADDILEDEQFLQAMVTLSEEPSKAENEWPHCLNNTLLCTMALICQYNNTT
jgi:hypothetical protein